MSDVLAIFEKLSNESRLDQQDLSGKFKFLPVSIQKAFRGQDSKVIRNIHSSNQLFSDANGVY